MSVLDDYLVDPRLSLLEKTRIQAQVLVPVLRALRSELGKERADAIVRQALRDWSKQLFAAIGMASMAVRGANGRPSKASGARFPGGRSRSRFYATTRRRWKSM
jgi:hypothetical protein